MIVEMTEGGVTGSFTGPMIEREPTPVQNRGQIRLIIDHESGGGDKTGSIQFFRQVALSRNSFRAE